MERVIPLSRRKGDIVILAFFWLNILVITYIVDVEQIVLPDISGDWEYPLWPLPFMVDIMPNGDVATCRDHTDYVVGNIQDDSLLSIYNNDRYRAFRRALKSCENGLFPICARCCGLMGY